MDDNVKFLIDELYGKMPDWNEYNLDELEKLIEIVSTYPEMFPREYEDKFQAIREEFQRRKR